MDERDISKDSSTDFPVELWMHIGSCVGLRDLSSLARTCTLFNQIMTPILYSSVHLYRESQAKAFLNAIAPFGKEDPEGVDPGVQPPHDQTRLQAVRDLRIHITETTDPEDLCEKAALAVARMNSLKTIWCGQPFQYTAGDKLLSALFMHPHPMLHTMSIPLYSGLEAGERAPPLPLKNSISTSLPSLLHVSIYFYLPLSLSHVDIIRNLLNSLGSQLETISIPDLSPSQTKELFSEVASFGALRHIGVNWFAVRDGLIPTVYSIRSLSLGLKHLRVIGHETAGRLPEAYFPALEELACDCKTLPAFLPPGMTHARPIRCVRLNNAYWTRDAHVGAHASMMSTFLDLALFPFMSHLVSALSYLGNSAMPVRELSFCVRQLLEEGLEDVRESWATLEKLVIIPRVAPDMNVLRAFGSTVLARAPRLHTLLLSDAVAKRRGLPGGRFWFARDIDRQRTLLEGFELHAPGQLRRVAFTEEFEWERGDGGRWTMTDGVDAEAVEEPGDLVNSGFIEVGGTPMS